MKKMILLSVLAMLCLFYSALAQTTTQQNLIKGTIKDENDRPLPGSSVRILSHSTTGQADTLGRFELRPSVRKGKLISSFVGYRSDTSSYDLDRSVNYSIRLKPLSLAIEDIVVSTGYQTLPKERATGSFAKVDNLLLNRRVGADVLSRLEGTVPGLLFNRNTSSSSRGGTDISIRGTSTLFSNGQPLIVIDGFPYEGDINNLNPNDIENITVLKDAAASSIWGVRSGNGVIVLTTKKGKMNQQLNVQFNANTTIGEKPNLYYDRAYLPAGEYIDMEKLLFDRGFYNTQISSQTQAISPVVQILADQRSGKVTPEAANTAIEALRSIDTRDGLDKYFYRRSVQQQYNLNFQGGGEKSTYYFSIGEDHNKANLTGNSSNRFTLNGNYTFSPVPKLRLSLGSNFIRSDQRTNNVADNLNSGGQYTTGYLPYLQFADANGAPLPIVKNLSSAFTGTAEQLGYLNWQYRPLDELQNADNSTVSIDNRYNVNLIYQPIKGLSADVKYQYEYASALQENYSNTATFYARNLINQYAQKNASGVFQYPIPVGGILQSSNAYLNSQQLRAQLNYSTTLRDVNQITAIAGAEVNSRVNRSNSNVSYGYNKDTEISTSQIDFLGFYNLNPSSSSQQIPNNQSFSKTTDHFLSYYSNASYSYDRRYTFSVSGRIDKSNLFGVKTNQKAVPLYSVGLAWNVGREHFYKLHWLPDLRLRTTYGYNANVNKTATAVTTLRQESNSYFSGIPYNSIANPGNPELRWERARMINVALDFASSNQVLTGTFEYFIKKSTDLFGRSPLPPSTGVPNFYGNTASTKGHGFDLTLSSRNLYGSRFKWFSDLQLSYVIDKVVSYDVPAGIRDYLSSGSGNGNAITPMVGQPIFGIYSFQSGPLTHDTGHPQGYLNGQLSTDYNRIIAGTKIGDLFFNGPSRPTTFGSFRNTVNYLNWSLSLNVIFKLNYFFRRTSTPLNYQGIVYGGSHMDYLARWQKPGDEEITSVPAILFPPGDNNRSYFYQYSQTLVEKGDHIRLQDIRLAYSFVTKPGRPHRFNQIQMFAYLNNIGILWRANHRGLDPDLFTGSLPLPLTVSIGTNLNF